MTLKTGLIGPTNLQKISKLTSKPVDFFLEKAEEIGRILAESGSELWVNSDKGMLSRVAQSYKKNKGKKLVVLWPARAEPWPNEQAKPYIREADKIRNEANWFWANYDVVSLPDVSICAGLSAGTLSELAYIKWNYQLGRGNLKKLVAVRELLRGERLPPEIEFDIREILVYIKRTNELKDVLT